MADDNLKCGMCEKLIDGKAVMLNNKYFCPECFSCQGNNSSSVCKLEYRSLCVKIVWPCLQAQFACQVRLDLQNSPSLHKGARAT
jgi:hypothetical protein